MLHTFRVIFFAVALVLLAPEAHAEQQKDFKTWLKEFKQEAVEKGISPAVVNRALPDTTKPIERVLELDRAQPEGKTKFEDYLKRTVTSERVQTGRTKAAGYRGVLNRVSETYGVEKQVIVALWGIETSYGRNTGGFDVVHALATLAYDGRRGSYFREELHKALKILQEGHVSHARMKGSWAGAMGQSQFMPTSFFRFAEDYNKDGRRDIWGTEADVFASAANYLSSSGWKKGVPWGRKVSLPAHFDPGLLGVNNTYTLQFWHDKGVRLPDGKTSIPFEGEYQASIVQPGGAGTAAFIVYDNYRVIMKWNKSSYFATAVGLLSDGIKGS
ncbi:MAG: lytic transglycosylase domain-containing protein [Alphaproteobacteria bacterium]